MAKRCSSKRARRPTLAAASRGPRHAASVWQRRLFRNWFTRQGRRYTVDSWAFRIQFQGQRRTFSLSGRTRASAARQAERLYKAIVSQGWEAATALHRSRWWSGRGARSPTGAGRLLKNEPNYWEQRLIRRRYHEARLVQGAEYSLRIEHGGTYSYFPLGSDGPRLAASRARDIHQTIVAKGWPAAFARFEREITLAVFWSDNPAAVTYTTLFTFLREPLVTSPPMVLGDHVRKPLVVVEPDLTTHLCLRYWLDRQPGFACPAVYSTARQALDGLARTNSALVLANRVASDMTQLAEGIHAEWPGLPVFPYRIHEDSDQIFLSISGGSGGYILRRRLPTALFDPLQPAAHSQSLTFAEAGRQIRDYFQSFFGAPGAASQPASRVVLSNREQEILNHISRGYLDKEIADVLNISIWTVHNHLKNMYEKLGVRNRAEAVYKYMQR